MSPRLALFAGLIALILAGCIKPSTPVDPVALTVSDPTSGEILFRIRERDLAAALERARLESDRDAPPLSPRAARALMERLIEEQLIERAVRQEGIRASTTAVARELHFLDVDEEARKAMARVYRSRQDLARSIAARLAFAELLALKLAQTSSPAEEIARSAPLPDGPKRVHASQIVVRTRAEARALKKKLNMGGVPFADLARAYSIAPEAEQGGDLGWFEQGAMPTVFETCFSLSPGEPSEIVASTYGYHIFVVHAHEGSGKASAEQARARALRHRRVQQRADAERAYLESLRSSVRIALQPEVLRRLGIALATEDI